jgi:cytoskeletal protein RodZ
MPEIGATLQEARMRAKIDISEVEAGTKIRAKYLRAIENEEWDLLPGPTFVKSFLRTYAEYLGIDAKLLVEEYKARHERPSDLDLAPIGPNLGPERRRLRPPRPSRGWIVGLSILGVLVLLIVLGSLGSDEPNAPQAPRRSRPAAKPKPKPRPAAPTDVRLQLEPTGPVYVCVQNADGKQLANKTISPGASQDTFRSKQFRVTVGNSQLKMKVNGKTLGVEPSSAATNYELTPKGRRTLAAGQGAC